MIALKMHFNNNVSIKFNSKRTVEKVDKEACSAADSLSLTASRQFCCHVSLGHPTKVKTREVTSEVGPVLRTSSANVSGRLTSTCP